LMPITQITEISLTWDHKSSFFHSKVVIGASPLDPTGGLLSPRPLGFAPPGKISWLRHCTRGPIYKISYDNLTVIMIMMMMMMMIMPITKICD